MSPTDHEATNRMPGQYTQQYLTDVLQWDVSTWQKALVHWDKVLNRMRQSDDAFDNLQALDIGARDGGLSLYLARQGVNVICSDISAPSQKSQQLHRKYGVDAKVHYMEIDATAIPLADNSLDIVVFKSVLGAVGQNLGVPAIARAVSEMYRVLKPGGVLLFAENQQGSGFHRIARRCFRPWGQTWHYVSLAELEKLLSVFTEGEIETYGFFSCMKNDFPPLVLLDSLVCRKPSSTSHYMAFGHATK